MQEDLPKQTFALPPDLLAALTIALARHRAILRNEANLQPSQPSPWVSAGRLKQNQSWHPRQR